MKSRPIQLALAALSVSTLIGAETRDRFSVMSFNCWHDGSRVDRGFEKIKTAIAASKADVVGMQESSPDTARRLAAALGWHHAEGGSGSVQILSRHKILASFTADEGIGADRFIAARIRIEGDPEREVVLCGIHLDYLHYGPYAAGAEGATPESVMAENAKSERVAQMTAALLAMKPFLAAADRTPVVLTGDFNVPSHLDWTLATASSHAGVGPVAWPESMRVAEAGMTDAFRFLHPDPQVSPGTTWSVVHKAAEPQDRIDFVYFKGSGVVPVEASTFTTAVETTLGAWGCDESPAAGNSWPSDHAAVLTTFRWKATGPAQGTRR